MQSNEIREYLVSALRLNEDNKEKDSYYGEYKLSGDGLLVIRVSNHRTYLSTWDERYKPTQQANSKVMRRMGRNLPDIFRNKTFYSFVFEDGDTVGNTEVPSGRRIIVNETVYKSTDLNLENLRNIKEGISQLSKTGQYNAEVLGQYQVISNRNDSGLFLLKNLIEESIHNYFMNISNYQYINENNQLNCNKKMNRNSKSVIRLTESELRDMIIESVKRCLKEDVDESMVENALQRVRNGEDPNDVFDYFSDFNDGFAVVKLNGKYNWIDTEGNPLSPNQWFDWCCRFNEGYAAVQLNGKFNLIDTEGNLFRGDFNSLDQWFDWCGGFYKGFSRVQLNGKDKWIDTEGNLYSYKRKRRLGINVKTMNNQNETIMNAFTNMIMEKVMHRIQMHIL